MQPESETPVRHIVPLRNGTRGDIVRKHRLHIPYVNRHADIAHHRVHEQQAGQIRERNRHCGRHAQGLQLHLLLDVGILAQGSQEGVEGHLHNLRLLSGTFTVWNSMKSFTVIIHVFGLLRKINTALPVRQGGLWDVY